jgi:hypothetical protein
MADMASITAGLNAVKLAFNIAKDLRKVRISGEILLG